MSSKIEVSREQLEEWQKTALQWGIDSIGVGIMHVLAAPVVERQPVECKCSAGMAVVPWLHAKNCPVSCYIAPPELAELQATIDQLETKLNNAINLDFERREEIERLKTACSKEFQSVEQLKVEIERLKGGQGEPVAWIVTDMNGDSYFAYDKQTPDDEPLYASHPAPDTRPSHANAPADSGTHPHNDGLDDYRGSKK